MEREGRHLFWLSDDQWRRIESFLATEGRGAHRIDDRRVLSGIVHMLKTAPRWRDCPSDHVPYTTICNRFDRWSNQGVWADVFYALTGSSGVIRTTSADSTHVKAHRSAAGAEPGTLRKPSADLAADGPPGFTP